MNSLRGRSLRGWAALVLLAVVGALGMPGAPVAQAAGASLVVDTLNDADNGGDGHCCLPRGGPQRGLPRVY
jgi:hypothetical protein